MEAFRSAVAATATVAFALTAGAYPVAGVTTDLPQCDPLVGLIIYEELGTSPAFDPFPIERIAAQATNTAQVACRSYQPDTDPTNDWLVSMTNLTGRNIVHPLLFVVDDGGAVGNRDGLAISAVAPNVPADAFKINARGLNRPLVNESIVFDGIFQAGETWDFIVNDFLGVPAGPPVFSSLNFAGASNATLSNASIVTVVPTPGALVGGVFGLLIAARRRCV